MERNAMDMGGTAPRPYYDRMDYQASGYIQDSELNRERALRVERDIWNKAVDEFIDERRLVVRDRSPHRVMERGSRDWDWKDSKRKDSRERELDRRGARNFSRGDSQRGEGDSDSNSSDGSYKHRKNERWQEGEEEKAAAKYSSSSSRSSDSYRDEERKAKETSRDGHVRNFGRNDRKRDEYGKYDGYDSETRDSGEYDGNNRSKTNDLGYANDFDKMFYKDQAPNRTIIIRGLAQHITESDIWQDTVKCNLMPKDIRLIRRKDTGTSRGFAFVEFLNTSEAIAWMEMKQGELMLKDHYRAVMQYSLQRIENGKEKWVSDWHCKCSAHNFKRRDFCYKCGCTRQDGELMEGYEEACSHPTYTVLLRGLDALTTEENVLQSIQCLSTLPIRSVEIGRDTVTNTSRGVCYLKMNSVVDSVYLHNTLLMASPVVIDGKHAVVSYCRIETPGSLNSSLNAAPSTLGSAAIAAARWSHQNTNSSSAAQYTLDDVNKLAEYSANLYATTPQEKVSYLAYYKQYYEEQISKGIQISLPSRGSHSTAPTMGNSPTDSKSNSTVATASAKNPLSEAPSGAGNETYPIPDVSTYQYDKTSGYYYDPYTTLYYDANSQYYYNQKTQIFLYWDAAKSTYLPAPTAASTDAAKSAVEETTQEEELKKTKEKDKQSEKDKVKVAKRIAKDMEKWAKTLNHKKEIARQNLITAQQTQPSVKTQGAADIGFAVLERKDLSIPSTGLPIMSTSPTLNNDTSLVAAYGQGSDSEEDDESGMQLVDDKQFTDWSKLACLLCKRQFPTKDILVKHQQLSDLHKQNLEQWYKARGLDPNDVNRKSQQYRDRAKERRQKYGEPDNPQPNRLKETYMKAREATVTYEEPTKRGLGSDNLGNKLLQKMGWQEGMGLGKKNQGRTSIIETERRSATAGLGTKSQGVVPGPGETYKDCVRKMMKIRYQEIEERS